MYTNRYIFTYASVMILIVAAVLATAASILKPFQDRNIEIEKKQDILKSIQIQATFEETKDLFDKYVKEASVVNSEGNEIDGVVAFDVDLKVELKKELKERALPVYISVNEKGEKNYIFPVRGKGLWGPIWGYIALSEDKNTVVGASFGHKSETPGLGAEISTREFQQQFEGDKLFDESGDFKSIMVVKGGTDASDLHGVDAISGGTITSKAVEEMLLNCLSGYEAYLKK